MHFSGSASQVGPEEQATLNTSLRACSRPVAGLRSLNYGYEESEDRGQAS